MRYSLIRLASTARINPGLIIAVVSLAAGCVGGAPNPGGLPPGNKRSAFQSPCAQNVIACTVTFPTAEVSLEALGDQVVTPTDAGFIVQGSDSDGAELVQLIGSDSTAGEGAAEIFFSWSSGAVDDDPCSLEPGEEFSTEAEPQVLLQAGFHYIRLTVTNDLAELESIDSGECGTFENFRRYDFVEVEIEVIDD